jgi:putative transposase
LKGVNITRAHQVWQVDITYLRMREGFVYLTVFMDVYSRYVVGWSLSNTLDTRSCLEALQMSLTQARPEIINTDQGCQFTSEDWVGVLKEAVIKISMTGKGRCLDNIYIERFWRSFKQEEFYLNDYMNIAELRKAIHAYIEFYNHERWHQSLNYKRPADLYFSSVVEGKAVDMVDNTTCYPHTHSLNNNCFFKLKEKKVS